MVKDTCEVCGYQSERREVNKYHIVPSEVMRKVGRLRSRKIALCNNCHQELDEFYLKVVPDMTYDTKMKQFRVKSPQEMVKEYETAYQRFTRYKKEQQKRAQS